MLGSVPRALKGHVSAQMSDINTLGALFLAMGSGIMRSGIRKKCYSFLTVALTLFNKDPPNHNWGK